MIIISQGRLYRQQGNPSTESFDTPNCAPAALCDTVHQDAFSLYLSMCMCNFVRVMILCFPCHLTCYYVPATNLKCKSFQANAHQKDYDPPCIYFLCRQFPAHALEGDTYRVSLYTKWWIMFTQKIEILILILKFDLWLKLIAGIWDYYQEA